LTTSGSDEWSRGVVLGTTEADPVAVTVWEDTTFVAWVAENNQLRLAQLDTALGVEGVTDLALTATYPRDLRIWAEAADRLHLAWVDSVEGAPVFVQARLVPGQSEPFFWQEIPLPADADHIETVIRPEARRLEIFWSANHRKNSGIHHQAVSLAGDKVTPAVRLTETGWQPGVEQGPPGTMHIAWADEETRGYVATWYARFDPESQSLDNPVPVTKVRMRRAEIFQGPAVGSAGTQAVVMWSTGNRMVERGFFDRHWGGRDLGGAFRSFAGAAGAVRSDQAQYVLVPSVPAETMYPARSLTAGKVVGFWKGPRTRTMGDQTWVVFSGWVAQRSNIRLQIVVVPFDEKGQGESVLVTRTWSPSVQPDLAVGADGTLRATWFEPIGDDLYQVVVASTAPEARKALGGFRLTEWGGDVAALCFDFIGLLGFAPLALAWTILPLGLVLVATVVRLSSTQRWQETVWLGAAVLLQLTCKRLLFPALVPLGPDPVEIGLFLAPVVLGAGLVWFYWRRAEEPLLVVAYGLFASVDVVFSLFVMLPRILWGT